jgi:mannitol/fructose-specific phosphotransferase system IIA component (Ntr-type)
LLTALLPPERIRVPLGSHSRHALFRELLELAMPDADPATLEAAFQGVLAREVVASTAIGDGLAVPHGRTNAVASIKMSAGIVEGVEDYAAPDGVPVRLCFLVVTPEADAAAHLRVLGRLARLMRNDALRNALVSAPDAEAFRAVLVRAEAG